MQEVEWPRRLVRPLANAPRRCRCQSWEITKVIAAGAYQHRCACRVPMARHQPKRRRPRKSNSLQISLRAAEIRDWFAGDYTHRQLLKASSVGLTWSARSGARTHPCFRFSRAPGGLFLGGSRADQRIEHALALGLVIIALGIEHHRPLLVASGDPVSVGEIGDRVGHVGISVE